MSDHCLAPPATQDPRSFCGPLYQAGERACADFDQCFYDGRHCLETTKKLLKYKEELVKLQAREGTLRRKLADANNSKAEQARLCDQAINEVAEVRAILRKRPSVLEVNDLKEELGESKAAVLRLQAQAALPAVVVKRLNGVIVSLGDELAETKAALGSSTVEGTAVRALLAAETASCEELREELEELKAARPAKRRCSARPRGEPDRLKF